MGVDIKILALYNNSTNLIIKEYNMQKLLTRYLFLNPNELSQEQILNLEHEIKNPKPGTISDEYLDFKLWYTGLPSRQEKFAEFLANKLPSNAKLLEVGCGTRAKLSRLLYAKGFHMTAIDPKVDYFENPNIITINASFDKTFDVTDFDFVIAQEPCDATEHIVRACTTQNIPFIMSLCGIPHKLISGEMPKTVNDWYKYLSSLDSKIKLRFIELDPFTVTAILKNF